MIEYLQKDALQRNYLRYLLIWNILLGIFSDFCKKLFRNFEEFRIAMGCKKINFSQQNRTKNQKAIPGQIIIILTKMKSLVKMYRNKN